METIDMIEGCVVKHETSGTNKPICVLGVLLTDKGIEIREEMLSMLRGKFDIYTVEQQAPGVLFEYPALLYVRKLTQDTGKPCLYLHTKGAANTNYAQPLVRKMWYDELIGKNEKYLESVNKALTIAKFVRFEVGEGMEKKNEDFAAEVAAQLG